MSDVCSSDLSGAGDVDRALDPVRAAAAYELGHGCGSLDGDEGRDLAKQPARDQNAASAIALGERRRQRQPKLLSLIVVVIDGRELMGEQRSEEHTSELQSLMRISYAVFCLKK